MSPSFYVSLVFGLLIFFFLYKIRSSFRKRAILHKLLSMQGDEVADPVIYEQVIETAQLALNDFLQRSQHQNLPHRYEELQIEAIYENDSSEYIYTVWIYTSLRPTKKQLYVAKQNDDSVSWMVDVDTYIKRNGQIT